MRNLVFVPPNRGALWSMLALTQTQLAELCGLTMRQISHWTGRGYIATSGRNPGRYSGDAVDLCVLIKQGLHAGYPLRRAALLAHEYLAAELARQPGVRAIAPPALLDIREKLRGADAAIAVVLEVVSALVPEEPQRVPPGDLWDAAAGGAAGGAVARRAVTPARPSAGAR